MLTNNQQAKVIAAGALASGAPIFACPVYGQAAAAFCLGVGAVAQEIPELLAGNTADIDILSV